MLKKLLLIPLLLTSVMLVLVGCKPEDPEVPVVEAPKVNSVSVSTNDDAAGSVMVHVVGVDDDVKIYYVVIGGTDTEPTAEQIKAAVDYSGGTVHASGNGTGALLDKPTGLEGATTYQVALVLEKDGMFSPVVVRSAITLTVEDTVDKGDGTELNPFWVETVDDLEKVGSGDDGFYNNLYYILKNDLDLTAAGYGASGMSWTPLGRQYGLNTKFSGVFDGGDHTITGLYLRDNSGTEKWGFFYEIAPEGVVKNVHLVDVDMQINGFRLGGIAGYSKGLIYNVSVIGGTIEAIDAGDSQVGGIVGAIYEVGTVKKAFTNVTVKGSGRRIGGIAGSTDVAGSSTETIKLIDVYSVGAVIGTAASARQVAGITGYSRGTEITRAYSSSTIIGASQVGGLVGFFQQRSETTLVPILEDSFYMGASLIAFGEYNNDRSIGKLIGESSSTNGAPTLTNNYALDSSVLGDVFGEFTNVEGTMATAANFADSAWFTTNLSTWNQTTTWEFDSSAIRPSIIGFADDGAAVVLDIDLMIYAVEGTMGDNPGELVVDISLSIDADLYYIVVAKDDTAPTMAEIKAGVDYTGATIIAHGSVMAANMLNATITDIAEGADFDIYAVAETTSETTEIIKASATSTPGVALWGGTDPATLGWYEIHNLFDLETYRTGCNTDAISRSSVAKLMVDIDMSSEYGEGLKSWAPLGNSSAKWKGTFDGMNHTINGLYINELGNEGVGFFGTVEGSASISNLVLTNVTVMGGKSTGALGGYIKAQITNVAVIGGTVTSNSERVGGLIGRFAQDGKISKAYTDVTVTASGKYVGGVVGHADYTSDSTDKYVIIEDVYSLGVTTGQTNVGGIVGYLRGTLNRAIAFGGVVVTGESGGGVAGYLQNSSKVSPDGANLNDVIAANSYITAGSFGTVTRTSDSYGAPTFAGLFNLDTMIAGDRENGTALTAANIADAAWYATNLATWNFTDTWELQVGATRPTLKDLGTDTGGSVVQVADLVLFSIDADMGENAGELEFETGTNKDSGIYYIVVMDGAIAPTAAEVVAGVDYGVETVAAAGNILAAQAINVLVTGLTPGADYVIYVVAMSGLEEVTGNEAQSATDSVPVWGGTDPSGLGYYEIHLVSDLELYRDGVNDGSISNSSEFRLMNDLDLTSTYGTGLSSWVMLGNSSTKWKGTFDGQGFTIDGLYISESGTEYVGFFGIIEGNATIIDVTFTNVDVTGGKYTGALAGYAKAVITNVAINGGTVHSSSERVGGMIGRFAQAGFLSKSWTNVTVTADSKYVGGLVGHVDYTSDTTTKWAKIEDVYTLGSTTGTHYVGGIVGYLRGSLERAIAYGDVTATGTTDGTAAGIAGYLQNSSKISPDGAHLHDVIAANSSITGGVDYGVVTRTSGTPTFDGLFGLDTLVDGGRENGADVTAANLADSAWWTATLPDWDFTTTWELVGGLPYLK